MYKPKTLEKTAGEIIDIGDKEEIKKAQKRLILLFFTASIKNWIYYQIKSS